MGQAGAGLTEALGLDSMPFGVAFVDTPPEGVEHAGEAVPAGCGFWPQAARSVFWTEATDHAGCPIGLLTHGFEPTAEQGAEAMALVGEMEGLGYLGAGEAAGLPSVPGPSKVVVYGPADEMPVPPDAVVITADAATMMVLAEASGSFALGGAGLAVHGRPACQAIPIAMASGAPVASLGCAGMRTFTAVEPGKMILVVPGAVFGEFAERAAAMAGANATMRDFYAARAAGLG